MSVAEEGTCVQDVDEVKVEYTEKQSHLQFFVGDVVWTKASGYPWWPCMITTDPEFNLHFKQKGKGWQTWHRWYIPLMSSCNDKFVLFFLFF